MHTSYNIFVYFSFTKNSARRKLCIKDFFLPKWTSRVEVTPYLKVYYWIYSMLSRKIFMHVIFPSSLSKKSFLYESLAYDYAKGIIINLKSSVCIILNICKCPLVISPILYKKVYVCIIFLEKFHHSFLTIGAFSQIFMAI